MSISEDCWPDHQSFMGKTQGVRCILATSAREAALLKAWASCQALERVEMQSYLIGKRRSPDIDISFES